jgi:1-acyl-sn-glycerol-3-phosphate acyltransferase
MAKDDSTRKFNAFFNIFARMTVVVTLVIKYRIRGENKKLFKTLKPPYLLIPNHVTMFDPAMVNSFVYPRVHFVMSDANLRSKLSRWVYLKMCRVIPKTKAVSDSSTARQMIKLARENRVICVFAEGRATWDGVTHDIFFSTSKLIKVLKIPVVVPLISGGYLSRPRWAAAMRRGRMVINYKKIFDGPELKKMTPEQIHEKLLAEMWNDDYEYQRRTGQTFRSKKGAEYLERLLFICPACEKHVTLHSEGNRFYCTSCGFENEWTPEGYLKPVNRDDQPTRSVTQWAQWQSETFGAFIEKLQERKSKDPIFTDNNVTLKVGYKMDPMQTVMTGTMYLYLDRFTIKNEKEEKVFPIDQVDGVQVLLANKFEFYFEGSVYKFSFSNPRCSGYKYMNAIQKIAPEKTELE